jgi:hypothetical protein
VNDEVNFFLFFSFTRGIEKRICARHYSLKTSRTFSVGFVGSVLEFPFFFPIPFFSQKWKNGSKEFCFQKKEMKKGF